MAIVMGIKIGQRREPSAICVAETQTRHAGDRSAVHHLVRHLERLAVGTPFPGVAQRAGQIWSGIEDRASDRPRVYVDATGFGEPIVDIFDEILPGARATTPIYFTHGDRRVETSDGWRSEVRLGKAHLVCRLQSLLQTSRLHLPRMAEAKILKRELMEYEIRVESDANERYGAFPVGTQDDLVTSLGLAVQQDPIGPGIF